MTPRPVLCLVTALMTACGISQTTLRVCDFSQQDLAKVSHSAEKKVAAAATRETRNGLDGSPALEFTARLEGAEAGWAGCSLPVPKDRIPAGADTVVLDARNAGGSRGLNVTLTEADGSRWNSSVGITPQWRRHEIPVYRFRWFTGPASRQKTRPIFSNVVSVDPWVGNEVQGDNGFGIDNVAFADMQPDVRLRLASPTTLPLQKASTLRVEAVATSDSVAAAAYSGELLLDVADRNSANVPLRVPIKEGHGEFEIFPRRPGRLDLAFFEPYEARETSIPLQIRQDGLRVDFQFPGFDGQQVIFTNEYLAPKLELDGQTALPYSAHLSLRDHRGRLVHSEWLSVPEIHAGKARVAVFAPGLLTAEVKLATDPLYTLPHAPYGPAVQQNTTSPTAPLATPDTLLPGVTTTSVIGRTVQLEPIPTTATIVGEDRFTVWSFVRSPTENILYKSPFGICSGGLFHLPIADISTSGVRRLEWHRKIGSLWGRNDLWWNEIEPVRGAMEWAKADKVVGEYRNRKMNLLGILCYAAKWADGKAPADDTERSHWASYVSAVTRRFAGKIKAFEVWNEPNHGFWAPAPDADAYRELVKTTFEAIRKVSDTPRVVAGVTAGYDGVFLNRLMEDGYTSYFDVVSFHPYPERHHESPDDNYLDKHCEGVRNLLRRHQSIGKETWISEIGWPTNPGGVTELEQANYLVRAYAIALGHGLTKVFWFNLYDWERFAWQGGWDSHLGLLDSTYRPKPSTVAYQLAEYLMAQMYCRSISRQGKAVIYSFDIILHSRKWPGVMHIAWTPHPGDEEDIVLPMISGGPIYVLDYLGAEAPAVLVDVAPPAAVPARQDPPTTAGASLDKDDLPTTRTYRFKVTHEPLYIWDSGATPKRPAR